MKKLFLTLFALASALVGRAQNDVMTAILQHGDEATSFIGMNALIQALDAAVDGDMITLSEGSFNSPYITKSVSIYGAGFEKDEAAGTAVTMIKGEPRIGLQDETLKNVRLEGIYINSNLAASRPQNGSTNVEGLTITKCFINGSIYFTNLATNVEISQCVITGNISGNNQTIQSMQVLNTWLGGAVGRDFNVSSSINADHCIICGDYGGPILYTNCMLTNGYITSSAIAEGSVVYNCVTNGNIPASNRIIQNCYPVGTANMFADADNHNYAPTRTFEPKLPDEWKSNDGTEIGIRGGKGFNKIPGTPVVKNMKLQVEGKQLKVNYEAEVR